MIPKQGGRLTIYTSANIYYLPRARALAHSVRRCSPDARVVLLLCDVLPEWFDPLAEPFDEVVAISDLAIPNIEGWIFEHDVVELCTAAKGPFLREELRRQRSDYVMYLDPDVVCYQDLAVVCERLEEGSSVGLTPHITAPENTRQGVIDTEISCLKHGVYNLGFLLVRNDDNGRRFAEWWADRLEKFCRDDIPNGLFTDQRWVDLAPTIFDFVQILRDDDLNVASWNLHSRQISLEDGQPHVTGRPVVFYHYSGIGTGAHEMIRKRYYSDNPDVYALETAYEQLLEELSLPNGESGTWQYGIYDDGGPIPRADRLLYRESKDIRATYADPFSVSGPSGGFRAVALSRRLPRTIDLSGADRHRIDALALELFDVRFYNLQVGSERASSGSLEHYATSGWVRGLWPNPYFDTYFYLGQDVAIAESFHEGRTRSPIHHYLAVGRKAGLRPTPEFDETWYASMYPDVGEALEKGQFACAFQHYLRCGAGEGRSPGEGFDEAAYRGRYPDVREAIGSVIASGYHHYLHYGRVEGRLPR